MYAYAKNTVVLSVDGQKVRLYEGEVWDADDPVVAAHPDHFSPTPTKLRKALGHTKPKSEAPVEEATSAPGEKRRTRAR